MEPNIRVMPEGFDGALYKDITNIHPLGLAAVLVLGIAMLILPRRWSVLPMIIIACFISSVQKISIMSMDFNLLRIMVIFGVTRLMMRKEKIDSWKLLDKVIVLWYLIFMRNNNE